MAKSIPSSYNNCFDQNVSSFLVKSDSQADHSLNLCSHFTFTPNLNGTVQTHRSALQDLLISSLQSVPLCENTR